MSNLDTDINYPMRIQKEFTESLNRFKAEKLQWEACRARAIRYVPGYQIHRWSRDFDQIHILKALSFFWPYAYAKKIWPNLVPRSETYRSGPNQAAQAPVHQRGYIISIRSKLFIIYSPLNIWTLVLRTHSPFLTTATKF